MSFKKQPCSRNSLFTRLVIHFDTQILVGLVVAFLLCGIITLRLFYISHKWILDSCYGTIKILNRHANILKWLSNHIMKRSILHLKILADWSPTSKNRLLSSTFLSNIIRPSNKWKRHITKQEIVKRVGECSWVPCLGLVCQVSRAA